MFFGISEIDSLSSFRDAVFIIWFGRVPRSRLSDGVTRFCEARQLINSFKLSSTSMFKSILKMQPQISFQTHLIFTCQRYTNNRWVMAFKLYPAINTSIKSLFCFMYLILQLNRYFLKFSFVAASLCYPNPCKNGGNCTITRYSSYNCSCPHGIGGENCTAGKSLWLIKLISDNGLAIIVS